jgi:hypothetical protein
VLTDGMTSTATRRNRSSPINRQGITAHRGLPALPGVEIGADGRAMLQQEEAEVIGVAVTVGAAVVLGVVAFAVSAGSMGAVASWDGAEK